MHENKQYLDVLLQNARLLNLVVVFNQLHQYQISHSVTNQTISNHHWLNLDTFESLDLSTII